MISVTISEAEAILHELIQKAHSGETVIITADDSILPLAQLKPIPSEGLGWEHPLWESEEWLLES